MLNIDIIFIPLERRAGSVVLISCLFILFSGCALTTDPERSGGEILAIPEGSWCRFTVSGDGRWLQYMGDESPLLKENPQNSSHQRQTFLIDLETDENYFAEPDPDVQDLIAEGFGPDGLGCFSPDNTTLYFTTVDWSDSSKREQHADTIQDDRSQSPGLSIPARQRNRFYFAVDLTTKPFIIWETDQRNCAERPDAVKPDIRVQQPFDKRVEIYSNEGRRLARHRPRGWLGNSISIWDLDHNQWEMDYNLSLDGHYLAYRISERGLIGFSAPTRGYVLTLSPDNDQGPVFLAASVYSMAWDIHRNFYACTSHRSHRRTIVRWTP